MNEIYRKNLKALEDDQNDLFKELKSEIEIFESNSHASTNETFEWIETEGYKNFNYQRRDPYFKGQFHASNPVDEARSVIQGVDLQHPTFVCVFGIGLGYIFNEFLTHRPRGNFALVVVEKNPQIFLRALCVHDFTKAFADATIAWIITPDVRVVQAKFNPILQIHNTVSRIIRILATPRSIEIDNAYYAECASRLLATRDHVTFICGNSVQDAWMGFKNTMDNLFEAIQNPGLAALLDQFKGQVCVSVAAGPSVNEHWETLKALQGKVPIIACDTLLKPMNEHGIQPDFLTALERDDYVTRFFRNIPVGERTTLVGPTLLLKDSFDCFQGEKVMYAPIPSFSTVLRLDFLHRFHGGGSAGNLNLNLAKAMGFKTIILVGHNLAYGYKTNETHVKGTIDQDRERGRSLHELQSNGGHQVQTQDETDVVWTKDEWDLYRHQIEDFTATNSDLTVINTALKGAKIAGTKTMTLEDAVKTYIQEPKDIFEFKKKLLAPPAKEIRDGRMIDALVGAKTALSRLEFWIQEGEATLKKLKQWQKKIELKESEGKHVTLQWLNDCLDEVLVTKVKAINMDPFFHNAAIAIIFSFHMTFERMINEMPGTYKTDYELKRDFLTSHIQYFEVWMKWLPKIADEYRNLIDAHPEFKVEALPLEEQYHSPEAQKIIGGIPTPASRSL